MLKEFQRKYLRGRGHALKPVVIVGDKGLTATVLGEVENALGHHELIKVRLRAGDRALRDDMIHELCNSSGADLVQRTGNIALLYRHNPEAGKIRLPAA
jgi:RNA-binding protein